MKKIAYRDDKSAIPILPGWNDSEKFNCKNTLVTHKGRVYEIVQKKERNFHFLERTGRILLGSILVVISLSTAFFLFKSVRKLFTKSKKSIRYAVLTQQNEQRPNENSSGQEIKKEKHEKNVKTEKNNKILPVSKEKKEEIESLFKNFKKKALDLISNQHARKEPSLEFLLTKQQKELLLNAEKKKELEKTIEGVKQIRGGCNFVFFLDSLPSVVFKPMENKEEAEKYVAVNQQATKVTLDKKLHLLHVPQCKILELNGKYFIMQEKADLFSGEDNEIKGLFSRCWDDKEMIIYIEKVFEQLLEFICLTRFSDVRYDNIPLTNEGRMALFDLDSESVIEGLTGSGPVKNNGLFKYLPYEYLDKFLSLAKEKINQEHHQNLQKEFSKKKNEKSSKLHKKGLYLNHCQNNSISLCSQLINPNIKKIFKDERKQKLANYIIENINQDLPNSKNVSIKEGRTIYLKINTTNPITQKTQEIWGGKSEYPPSAYQIRKEILPEIMDELKKSGYIYKYKISEQYHFIKVVC